MNGLSTETKIEVIKSDVEHIRNDLTKHSIQLEKILEKMDYINVLKTRVTWLERFMYFVIGPAVGYVVTGLLGLI